uniref:Uncharacterized protein n=1 Tax=Lactuca sativa TaxID=4236 RepID=A0A9R1VJF0_LACSA|nr:hypothetical protein LSAT_V11C500253560 [Lactuca sativa]
MLRSLTLPFLAPQPLIAFNQIGTTTIFTLSQIPIRTWGSSEGTTTARYVFVEMSMLMKSLFFDLGSVMMEIYVGEVVEGGKEFEGDREEIGICGCHGNIWFLVSTLWNHTLEYFIMQFYIETS